MPPAKQQILDKEGNVINEGDTVATAARSRKHRGVVEAVVINADDAAAYNVNNPPKVVFHDEEGTIMVFARLVFLLIIPGREPIRSEPKDVDCREEG